MSAGEKAGVRPKIERRNGRIYFGEGEHEWSCWDPSAELSENARLASANDLAYLVCACPDTKTAIEKLRLIRWAVRNVTPDGRWKWNGVARCPMNADPCPCGDDGRPGHPLGHCGQGRPPATPTPGGKP